MTASRSTAGAPRREPLGGAETAFVALAEAFAAARPPGRGAQPCRAAPDAERGRAGRRSAGGRPEACDLVHRQPPAAAVPRPAARARRRAVAAQPGALPEEAAHCCRLLARWPRHRRDLGRVPCRHLPGWLPRGGRWRSSPTAVRAALRRRTPERAPPPPRGGLHVQPAARPGLAARPLGGADPPGRCRGGAAPLYRRRHLWRRCGAWPPAHGTGARPRRRPARRRACAVTTPAAPAGSGGAPGRGAADALSRRSRRDLLPGPGRGPGDRPARRGDAARRGAERVVDGATGGGRRRAMRDFAAAAIRLLADDAAWTAMHRAALARGPGPTGRRRGSRRWRACRSPADRPLRRRRCGSRMSWPAPRMGGAEAFYERPSPRPASGGRGGAAGDPARRRAARRGCGPAGLAPVECRLAAISISSPGRGCAVVAGGFRPRVVVAWANRASRYAGAVKRRGAPWTLVGRMGGYYDLKYYRHCDHLVGNTRDIATGIVDQGWPADAGPLRAEFRARPAPAPAPAALPAPAGAPMLLALGRLHPNKGFDVLLRALALLPGRASVARRRGAGAGAAGTPGGRARRRGPGRASWAGGQDPARCWPAATSSSAPRATSRWAMWCWRPGRRPGRWSRPRRRGRWS